MAGTEPTGGGTDTLDRELEELLNRTVVDEGDHERFSHYAPKNAIMESAPTGKPVRALCGKLWVPGRDPEKFPVCPTCKEIYETLETVTDRCEDVANVFEGVALKNA